MRRFPVISSGPIARLIGTGSVPDSAKMMGTRRCTATGWPFLVAGLNVHWLTAATAAAANSGSAFSGAWADFTEPSGSTMKSTRILPSIRFARRAMG